MRTSYAIVLLVLLTITAAAAHASPAQLLDPCFTDETLGATPFVEPENRTEIPPALTVQIDRGIITHHPVAGTLNLSYGEVSVEANVTFHGTTPPSIILPAPTTGPHCFGFTLRDDAGERLLAYGGRMNVFADGNLTVQPEWTYLRNDTLGVAPGDPSVTISYGHAAAFIVFDTFLNASTALDGSVQARLGLDQRGDGTITPDEVTAIQLREPHHVEQRYYALLPVATKFEYSIVKGDQVLGSVSGNFLLAGVPTLDGARLTQPHAPLIAARILALRVPLDVVFRVPSEAFGASTAGQPAQGNPSPLPVTVGYSPDGTGPLAPNCAKASADAQQACVIATGANTASAQESVAPSAFNAHIAVGIAVLVGIAFLIAIAFFVAGRRA